MTKCKHCSLTVRTYPILPWK